MYAPLWLFLIFFVFGLIFVRNKDSSQNKVEDIVISSLFVGLLGFVVGCLFLLFTSYGK